MRHWPRRAGTHHTNGAVDPALRDQGVDWSRGGAVVVDGADDEEAKTKD